MRRVSWSPFGLIRYALNEREWGLTIEADGKLKAYLCQAGWSVISCAEPLIAGTWHLAILTVSHGKALLFLNGKPVGEETATRDLLGFLNESHAAACAGESELQARMNAYELAARMQLSAPEVSDFASEPSHIHQLYGTDSTNELKSACARNCRLARRMLERGVRYVNLYCASRASGVDGLLNWDAHTTLKHDYERHCPVFDQPTAASPTWTVRSSGVSPHEGEGISGNQPGRPEWEIFASHTRVLSSILTAS
jgi:hypothetical protein